jgi:hypothetical protein
VSDWLDAARGRFDFLRRVAELHGCAVRVGTWSDEDWLGGAVAEEKRIFINMEQSMGEVAVRWLLEKHGKSRGVDAEACEWIVRTWALLHELGHVLLLHGRDGDMMALYEEQANLFARRVLIALLEDHDISEQGAADLCGRIAQDMAGVPTEAH